MKFDKSALIGHVQQLKAALATKDIVPALTHVWFEGEYMYGFNDVIGTCIPVQTEFFGGIKGEVFLGLIEKAVGEYIEITEVKGNKLHIVTGPSYKANLALMDIEEAVWDVPKFNVKDSFEITEDFLQAIENILISVGPDTSFPDQLGVTLQLIDDRLHFYSTDGKTLSWASIPKPENLCIKYAIFPLPFCRQMVIVCDKGSQLGVLTDNTVLVKTSTDRLIFSKLLESQRPFRYREMVNGRMYPLENFVNIPPELWVSLDRACVLFEGHVGEPAEFKIKDGQLSLRADTPLGEIRDVISVPGHDDVLCYYDPNYIKRVIPHQDRFYVTDGAFIITSSKNSHIVHFVAPSDSSGVR